MMMIKTLSARMVAPMLVASVLPAAGQVAFELSSHKVYRQDSKSIKFNGGSFVSDLTDGNFIYVRGCSEDAYYSPGRQGICAEGSTALISEGRFNGIDPTTPYLLVTSIQPATAIAPRQPARVQLKSAPASKLPRPAGGFSDDSLSVYYNLHSASVRQYVMTVYENERGYNKNQRGKFEKEIVPGVYHYVFPRLADPTRPAPLIATIYPMVEGYAKLNNKSSGFEFTQIGGKPLKFNNGFARLGFRIPNTISWRQLSPSVVFGATDDLYFSLRELQSRNKPKSAARRNQSIFPPYDNGRDPRVLLPSPYQTSYTLPPVFPSGTRGVIELEMERRFQTGSVTYDLSTRRFQMPFDLRDEYTEYRDLTFGNRKNKIKLLDDADNDGYNNMVEWILGSSAANAASIPQAPVPASVESAFGTPLYYGFNVDVKLATIPAVKYTLQRSTNGGSTWRTFVSDANWTVGTARTYTRGAWVEQIQVRSLEVDDDTLEYVAPPGTEGHLYRVKVTLAK